MKNLLGTLLPLLIVGAFVLPSCQKEPDGSVLIPPTVKCKVVKAEYLDGTGGIDDTSGYVYSGDKLTQINHTDYYNTLEYANNKVSKKFYHETGSTSPDGYDQFVYNGDGTLAKADFYIIDPSNQQSHLLISIELTYSGGKATKLSEKIDTNSNGVLDPIYEYAYTYTGNNITKTTVKDLVNNTNEDITYEYDNNANFFPKDPPALLTDVLFEDYSGDILPLVLSANNVTKVIQTGSSVAVSYTTDSNKNLTELKINSVAVVRYYHKCQ